MKNALARVRRFYPEVKAVEDSARPIYVTVIPKDIKTTAMKDHRNCAMAMACKREYKADAAIIGMRSAYLIFGKKAVRFRVPSAVSREIIAFDRNAGFATGQYKLNAPNKWEQLGGGYSGKTHNPSKRRRPKFVHQTVGVRKHL